MAKKAQSARTKGSRNVEPKIEGHESAPEGFHLIDAPEVYASSIQAYWANNDFTMVLSRARPGMIAEGKTVAALQPSAIVYMSTETAKDLYLLVKSRVEEYEKRRGEIVTDYSRRIAAGASTKK